MRRRPPARGRVSAPDAASTDEARHRAPSDRAVLGLLLAVATVEGIGAWLVAPVLPEIGRGLDVGPAGVGLLSAAVGAAQIPAYLLCGRSISRFGAYRALLVGVSCSALADVLYLVGGHYLVYLSARAMQGTGSAWIWMGIVFTVIERRGRDAGHELPLALVGYSIGHVLGPVVGGLGGIRIPFLVHLGLVVPLLAAITMTPRRAPADRGAFMPLAMIRERIFWYAMAAWGIEGLALGFLQGALPLHFAVEFTQGRVGALYTLAALSAAVGALTLGRFAQTPLRRSAVAVAAALYAIGLLFAGTSDQAWIWVLAVLVLGLGAGGVEPNLIGFVAHTVPFDSVVGIQTVAVEAFAVGLLVGPGLGGLIAEHAGFGAASAVIAVPALAFAAATWRPLPGRRPAPA